MVRYLYNIVTCSLTKSHAKLTITLTKGGNIGTPLILIHET